MGRPSNTIDYILSQKIVTEDGHWLYTGNRDNTGYGISKLEGKYEKVHRLSAHKYLGLDLNDSTQMACHKPPCNIRRCFNPEHLYVGNHMTNSLDRDTSKCIKGHDKVSVQGSRSYCKICNKESVKKYKSNKRNK